MRCCRCEYEDGKNVRERRLKNRNLRRIGGKVKKIRRNGKNLSEFE